jgi:hypothetical protein
MRYPVKRSNDNTDEHFVISEQSCQSLSCVYLFGLAGWKILVCLGFSYIFAEVNYPIILSLETDAQFTIVVSDEK